MNTRYHFETGVYRPPSEGGSHSLLLRITRNCPWNRCTFCSMYKEETFSLRSVAEITSDIEAIAALRDRILAWSRQLGYDGDINRPVILKLLEEAPDLANHHGFVMVVNWLASGGKTAFLQDANSLHMKPDQLAAVLKTIRRTFPTLVRVTSYARSKTIARRSPEELQAIREAGLDRLHVGLETGDDELLLRTRKGVTSEEHIIAGQRAMAAGFQLSEYWMPGLGGKAMWRQHAENTARVLNEISPHYARSRPFFPIPGTPIQEELERGEFQYLAPAEQLTELKLFIESLTFDGKVCFDHDGNQWTDGNGERLFSLSYEGYRFPEQKGEVLKRIEDGLAGASAGGPRRLFL